MLTSQRQMGEPGQHLERHLAGRSTVVEEGLFAARPGTANVTA